MAKKIVIDAGHGGDDSGAVGNGIIEKDLNLKISQYLHNRFNDLGIPNEMTRTSDVTLGPQERPLKAQSFYGKSPDVILLSNHINAGGGDGAEIIYSLRNEDTLAKKIADEFVKSGQNVRKYYQRRLPSNPAKDYYYMLRDTPNNESLIVEYGFLDSPGDDPEELKNNWEDLAEAVVRAVSDYAKVKYIPVAGSNSYVVKSGDTLWNLAKKFGVSVDELKKKNNLSGNTLSVGQVLLMPDNENNNEEEANYYIVKAGDSLWKIANEFQIPVAELMTLNNLTTSVLNIGDRLKIKGNVLPSADNYTVKAGDNLWDLANQFGTTVTEFKSLNNLSSDALTIGQILKIPENQVSTKTYTVLSGDSLWKIANEFETSVNELKRLNNLSSNSLMIGQKLIIP